MTGILPSFRRQTSYRPIDQPEWGRETDGHSLNTNHARPCYSSGTSAFNGLSQLAIGESSFSPKNIFLAFYIAFAKLDMIHKSQSLNVLT